MVPLTAACPKRMTYGPCGGVTPEGRCEVGELMCPFALTRVPEWSEASVVAPISSSAYAAGLRERLRRGRVIVADVPARALSAQSLRACSSLLSDADAVLIGDAPQHRVQFPPSYRAALVQAAGATAWVGLNARDRNRVALEGELAALADLGVAAVHCVTGDHPASGHRPDAAPVFDLDSTQLTALAARHGFVVSVAESPLAPPSAGRPTRLRSKERAGAEVCIVNFCGGPDGVAGFVRSCRERGSAAAMLACVPFVCDSGSAQVLASFREAGIDGETLARIIGAEDPRAEGIKTAVELGRRMLDTGLVAGINLSGGPGAGGELAYAEALAEVTAELRR